MRVRSGSRTVIAFLAVLLLANCGGDPPPPVPPTPPTVVELTVVSSPLLNPDLASRASPVVVRLYQLVSPTVFESSDFFQLYEGDAATLGADMLGREDLIVTPGGVQTLTRELKPETRFLGALASFRDYENSVWRAVVPVRPAETLPVTIRLDSLAIEMTAPPAPVQPMDAPADAPAP